MIPLTNIGILLLAVLPTVPAEDNPFAKSAGVEVRPQRTILKLPKAVTHRMIDANKHEYTISGIYSASAKNDELKDVASTYKFFIPDSLELDFDFKARKARFSTSRELTLSELAYAIDDILTIFCFPTFMIEVFAGRFTVMATALFLLATVPLIPLIHRGGFNIYIRFTISIAFLISALFGIVIVMEAYDLLNNGLEEGPNGEGSPISGILVFVFSGLLFFAPWILSAIRGMPLWHTNNQAEQFTPADSHQPHNLKP